MMGGDDPVQQRHDGEGDGGRLSIGLSRRLLADMRHDADLARLAEGGSGRWTDALLAETRFHLAGLMNAVELAIGLELADGPAEALPAQLGAGYARQAIETKFALLSPELLGHLRRRAAVSLLLRHNQVPAAQSSLTLSADQGGNNRYLDALAALTMAERNWHGPMLLDAPMRPDLPAEHYHDLVWTVAALLVGGGERLMGEADPALVAALARAAETLIARHDEGQGAFALAQRCARSLPSDMRFALAPAALGEARLLLFAALVECEAGLALEDILDALLGERDADRHALLRLMEIEDAVAFRTAELLAPVTDPARGEDAQLAEFVESYRAYDASHAMHWLVERMNPRALADKLALLERS